MNNKAKAISKKQLSKKILILIIIIVGAFLLFKLYDQSKILNFFPLDGNNDLGSYMAQLFFLKEYGFHAEVPLWYGGFTTFLLYPPGYFFFALPLYFFFSNIQFTVFFSLLLILALGFLFIYLLGKKNNFSLFQIIVLFLLAYANPIAIGNFIKLGRLPEMFAFTLFILFFFFFERYREQKINLIGAAAVIAILFSILISHPSYFVISSFFILSLFLFKEKKEKYKIALIFVLTVLLASFWLVPFIAASQGTSLTQDISYVGLSRLLKIRTFFFDNLFSFLLPIVFLFILYKYNKYKKLEKGKNKNKSEAIFYLPLAIFSILYFFRIAAFIPIINHPYPDTYNFVLIFLSFYLFFKTPIDYYGKFVKLIKLFFIFLPFIMVVTSLLFVSNFRAHNEIDKQVLPLIPEIEGKYLISELPHPSSEEAYYAYGSIFYKLSTADGWYPQMANLTTIVKIKDFNRYLQEGDCKNLDASLHELHVEEIISLGANCETLSKCSYVLKKKQGNACLYHAKK